MEEGKLEGKRSDSKEVEGKKKTLRWFDLRKEYLQQSRLQLSEKNTRLNLMIKKHVCGASFLALT